ncbi:DUF6193 family natural product biosynthesis protein [Streptomyces hydrogenans]
MAITHQLVTPQQAAALVVAHLPEDCGPAFEGPWLQTADSID